MFWSNAYTRFLEEEVKRLQFENRVLLSAMLEKNGHAAAAHMLRGDDPEEQKAAVTKAEQTIPSGRSGLRHTLSMLSAATRPKLHSDSVSALEDRIRAQ